jgi:mycothiol system anti-sigma-R factor
MSADCNETLRELDRFLDEEISDEARQHIHGHLEGCSDCLQAYEFHAELRAAIARKCLNDEMPPQLMDRLRHCLTDPVGLLDDTVTDGPGDPAPA